MAVELGQHQLEAIRQIKDGSILRGGVGTGKSRTAIAYFFTHVCGGMFKLNGVGDFKPMKTPRDLYIITTAKKRDSKDWEGEAAPFALSSKPEDSFGGVKVTVDSWNNIGKYTDVKDAFFIFDEQRLVGSGAWVKSFLRIAKSNRWIMLSATPGDVWLDYVPIFVAHGFYKNRTDFVRQHVVYKPYIKFPVIDRYVETGRLEKLRRGITVEMHYSRHTTRHIRNILVEHNKDSFRRVLKDRWHIYEERPIKNVAELFYMLRRVVNSDESRLNAVKTLREKHPRLIIFYNFNYELEFLRKLCAELGVNYAEWNGHKHEEIPDSDEWIYLVQYSAGAEGWNCTATDAIIFFSLNYSYRLFEQAQGRIDRLNTPYEHLYYYILNSNSMIDRAISRAISGKRNFNEKELDVKL